MPAASRRVWPVVLAVQLGVLLAALESTVVGTAMPTLIAALGGARLYPWVFAAYMLASTVVMPVFGGLSDRLGRKGPYLFAVMVFSAGALVAGAAPSMPILVVGRLLQGTGAGGILSLSLIIFGDMFAGPRRGQMQGLITGVWGLASLVGPVLGGVIVDQWSWRWVFYVNAPLGAVVMILVAWGFREPASGGSGRRLDVGGAAVFVVGATALLFTCLAPAGGGAGRVLAGAVAFLALGVFIGIEQRARDPLLPLGLFRAPVFAAGSAAGFFSGAAMFGALVHVPMLIQWGQGTDATTAGLSLMSMSGGWSLGALLAGQIMNRIGFFPLAVGGMVLLTTGYAGLAWQAGAHWLHLMWIGGATGVGMGLVSITLVVAVQTLIPPDQRGAATAGILFFRNVGATLGVALMGAVLTARLGVGLTGLAGGGGRAIPADLAAALVVEMGRVLWLGVGAAVAGLGATLLLPTGSPVVGAARRGAGGVEELIG